MKFRRGNLMNKDIVLNELREKLRELSKNTTAATLADEVGVSKSALYRFIKENSEPTLDIFFKISNFVNTKYEDKEIKEEIIEQVEQKPEPKEEFVLKEDEDEFDFEYEDETSQDVIKVEYHPKKQVIYTNKEFSSSAMMRLCEDNIKIIKII
jgi:transcriptional regulator with XRE-family HTH domain